MSTTPRVLPQVYLNGAILPIEQAHIPVLDRGYLFGDALYEVIPVYAGRLFRPERHLERLAQGLRATGISSTNSDADWLRIFTRVIDANGGGDMAVYLQVSRGVASYRDHAVRTQMEPGIFAMAQTLIPRADDVSTRGVRTVLLEDTRWARCNIKATSLLANVLLRQQA
ncbi:MAG: D-amino acid aminotransferase, partial [Gammaproteobacteria bacterium]|nr:D-amino acid aminotransferase [Gammaproteobacteria bacterium]